MAQYNSSGPSPMGSPAPLLQQQQQQQQQYGFDIGPSPPPEIRHEMQTIDIDSRLPAIVDNFSSSSPLPPVTLTWNDLCVTIPRGQQKHHHLLHGMTGYAEPRRIMAIMGPSGSGKSTLLDTLAGRLNSNVRQSGEILVNGRKETLAFGNSAYVTQDDVLLATLTVREAVHYSAELQLPRAMAMAEKRARAESSIRDMGLVSSAETRIGGWRARGLSGGEKRRVSIAIELLTRPNLLFLDEPTSGLDSAAAFHVVKRLKHLALEGRTIIASIHQPSGDVFELFDFLYLLCNGKTVYFGPAQQAQEFFASSGFPCPSLQNPSDHYLRTINKDFEPLDSMEAALAGDDDQHDKQGMMSKPIRTEEVIEMLVKAHRDQNLESVMRRVDELSKTDQYVPIHVAAGRSRSSSSFFTQVKVLTVRSSKNMYRDLGYYWLRLAIYMALGLCIGTVFFRLGTGRSDIQARASAMAFISGFLTFMAIGGFPSFVEDIKVFERERLNGHYGLTSFVFAHTLSSAPYLLLISVIPGAIVYVMVDLHHGFLHFLYFVLMLYSAVLVVESLMIMIASIVPDFLFGIIVGAGVQGIFLLNGGFFRLPNDIPNPVWKYPVSFMAFHTYVNEGFYKNDFIGLTFESNEPGSVDKISGETILKQVFQVKSLSKWVDLLIVLGMAILYRAIFIVVIKLKEKLSPIIKDAVSKNV